MISPISLPQCQGHRGKIIDYNTAPRYKIPLKGLGAAKSKSGDVSMMLKTEMKVTQDSIVFN